MRVTSLMLRYHIRDGPSGGIDKIGIRDGDFKVHEFANLGYRKK
jgi:hypothetical protein